MKKFSALLLALTMLVGLCACGAPAAKPSASPNADAAASPAADDKAASLDDATITKGVLRVGMECAYAPYNWTQADNSNGAVAISGTNEFAFGYDVMMAKAISEKLGLTLEIVRSDWDGLVMGVQSGTIDCAIAGQSITAKRAEMVDFTTPYYYATIVTLVKAGSKYENAKSVADLAGATCTSQMNTIWYDTCLPQIPEATIQPAQENAPTMLVSLASNACDLVVTDQPTGKAALIAYPDFKLLDFTGTDGAFKVSDEEVNIGISVQKGNKALQDAINGVLSGYTPADFTKMMDDAIAVQPLSK
ncbi:MAG: transporter substrate-binding domain-containing protein [Oscillospiraceae bacterium]